MSRNNPRKRASKELASKLRDAYAEIADLKGKLRGVMEIAIQSEAEFERQKAGMLRIMSGLVRRNDDARA